MRSFHPNQKGGWSLGQSYRGLAGMTLQPVISRPTGDVCSQGLTESCVAGNGIKYVWGNTILGEGNYRMVLGNSRWPGAQARNIRTSAAAFRLSEHFREPGPWRCEAGVKHGYASRQRGGYLFRSLVGSGSFKDMFVEQRNYDTGSQWSMSHWQRFPSFWTDWLSDKHK
ncbi:hypothetical protein PHLGIDRAFT_17755 [Phlebiopsis gigantea 11061_1 CR5-6]|uniref:Uncharacterized protein n=1 Tax=Phlebiopsis gigantea (strain 11061_1 CR5-6) TaxID=745531 RepID=A0A0C3P2P2_PHLG1|nr:hypothetical protein PHLGIDRAFT_17755 [Phlebiopsis gigantea 11061_1 CR5-6]